VLFTYLLAQLPFHNRPSIFFSKGCLAHGANLKICISLGALNDALKRINASCADSKDRRSIAVLSPAQRLARAASILLPVKNGPPRSSALWGARKMKLLTVKSVGLDCEK